MKKLLTVFLVLSAIQVQASMSCEDIVEYLRRSRDISAEISELGDLSKLDSEKINSLSSDVYNLTSELGGLGSIKVKDQELRTIQSVGETVSEKNATLLKKSDLQKINHVRINLINQLVEQRDNACKSIKSD